MRYPQTDREFQEAEEARERTRKSDEADFDNYGARQNSILHFSCGIDLDPEELISSSPKTAPAPIDEQPCDCGHPDCTWCELLNPEEIVGPPARPTGRLTESQPAYQNIPIKSDLGRKIAEAFSPKPSLQEWTEYWDLTDADLRPEDEDGKEAA